MSASLPRLTLVTLLASIAIAAGAPTAVTASPGASASTGARALAAQELRTLGYLVPDPGAYLRAKSRAESVHPAGPRVAAGASLQPKTLAEWAGVFDPSGTPSDSTGAIGPTRYVEMVNTRFAFYTRTGKLVSRGELGTLTHFGAQYPFLTDPQVFWDPGTQRFYFVVLDADVVFTSSSNGVDFAYGFSKTSTPNDASSWCVYHLSYGYDVPQAGRALIGDQPHLGDTRDFILWGVNIFDINQGSGYVGSDVDWVRKPGAGTSCPPPPRQGVQRRLKTASGSLAFSPTVARQVDTRPAGWVVATPVSLEVSGSASALELFKVTRNSNGSAHIQGQARAISVAKYSVPPNAQQAGGGGTRLDTSDARLTQAVNAVDPGHGGPAVWTVHAVTGGAGSELRWYEIDPLHARLFQHGVVSDNQLFAFNGGISPDRTVRPGVAKFGRDMVIAFNTSSKSADVGVQMVSKVGDGPQSGFVRVHQSPAPELDFSCRPNCRWGDYPGASPDPAASVSAPEGLVWLTEMWSAAGANSNDVDWRTWNWEARP